MLRLLASVVVMLLPAALLVATPARAQVQPPVGVWDCYVNSPIVSIAVRMQVAPNGQLGGQGSITYVQTNRIYNVQGSGDWTYLPPDAGNQVGLFKFRMFPQNHAIFSWFARPNQDPNFMNNVFQNPENGMVTETSCQRIG